MANPGSFSATSSDESSRMKQADQLDSAIHTHGGGMKVSKDLSGLSENLEIQAAVQKKDEPTDTVGTIRVPVSLLDKLMTLMGEMVLVRNQVLQYSNHHDDLEFLNLSQRLDVVTSELQGEVMKTRMQPIGNVISKFQRIVRDLGQELGKSIELTIQGAETELDKTLLEAIKDPLTHILRNSCDHGIETITDRRKKGKPETGRISIRAFHEGGQVVIEISDDGGGLDRGKLIAKAVEKGIVTADQGSSMTEREVFSLIFAPGFSTAAKVTNVSGRGVGMDVVKSNVEKIGGIVEITSPPGAGTTTRLKIPLTLAIVPAMIVSCEKDLYAIPQVKLVELVRLEKGKSGKQIEYLQGKPVYRLRGNILPLIDLKEVLGLPMTEPLSDVTNLVVLNGERKMFGLIVDEIQDTADIVVKPLNRFLKSLSVYSGATVLGNGSVALILDVIGIAQRMNLTSELQTERLGQGRDESAPLFKIEELQEFILFKLNAPAKHALPLGLVNRLEEFKRSAIEYSGDQRVVRYRNSILPLINLNAYLGYPETPPPQESPVIPVIVTQKGNRSYGIEVNEILDVLTTDVQFDSGFSDRSGLLGNLVANDEVIVIVDTLSILDQTAAKLRSPGQESRNPKLSCRILLAEDTAFFRKHISSVLEGAGHVLTTAVNGLEAWEILTSSPEGFDLVISDIEMPKMTGLELAKQIRSDGRWGKTPLIAVTSRFSDREIKDGKIAGFDHYLEKMNPDELTNLVEKIAEKVRNTA